MFEKEIKFISDFSLNQVKYLGQEFSFEKILSTELHPAIIQYISAELDFMIFADRRKLMQQSFFDYSGKEISYHFRQISDEIKKSKIISLEDVKKLIIQSVSFNANYVVRPKWSLTKLIYNDQSTISVDELEIMLSYIYYYDYIRNVLTGYLIKRKVVQLSLSEFDLILNRIDRELFKTNSERLIDNALNSIGDFFNIGGVDKTLVSPTAIEILFKEKNLLDLVTKLHKGVPSRHDTFGETTKKNLKINDIKRILYSTSDALEKVTEKEGGESKNTDEVVSDSSGKKEEEPGGEMESEKKSEPELSNKPSVEPLKDGEKTLGELAELHAEELEKAGTGEFLSPEEEETLRSLYNEDMAVLEEQGKKVSVENEVQPDEFKAEVFTEQDQRLIGKDEETDSVDKLEPEEEQVIADEGIDEVHEPVGSDQLVIDQKEIVNEMMHDYFVGVSEVGEIEKQTEEKLKPKNLDSLEEELFEVFEELDKLDNSLVIEEEPVEDEQAVSDLVTTPIEAVDKPDTIVIEEESAEEVLDDIENDLKTIDEIAFTDEELVVEKPREEKPVTIESQELPDISSSETQPKNEIKEGPGFQEIPSPTIRKRDQESPTLSPRKTRKKDFFSYLKRKEIQKIISNIFGNDEDDFVNTTEKIMECASYKEASDILKSVFTSYKISPYSKEAVSYANAVSNYFRQA